MEVVSHGDQPLTPEQVAAEAADAKRARREVKNLRIRLLFWWMDRAYIQSLSKGLSVERARFDASHAAGLFSGFFGGLMIAVLVFGAAGWFYNLVDTLNIAYAVIVVFGWALLFWAIVKKIPDLIKRRKN